MKIFEYCPDPKEINDSLNLMVINRRKHRSIHQPHLFDIREKISKFFGLGVDEITSSNRRKNLIEARAIYYKICTEYGYSREEISRLINRHRSTCYHYEKIFNDWYLIYPEFREKYEQCKN